MKRDADGEIYDVKTGELAFRRTQRTPEQIAEAKRVRDERAELRRRELAMLEALSPSLAVEGEVVRYVKPRRLAGSVSLDGTLLRLDRLSGRGLPGSSLAVVARDYDGLGPNGGEPHSYVTLFVACRDSGGHLVRTQGVAVHNQ